MTQEQKNWMMVLEILMMFVRKGNLNLVRGAIVYAAWAKPPELFPKDWNWADED